MPTELLFSYGTLQLEAVQMATFGRKLTGTRDVLPGFEATLLVPDVSGSMARNTSRAPAEIHRSSRHFLGATILVMRPTLVSPAYRLSCLSMTQ